MFERILVPTDGSDVSRNAAETAIAVAGHVGADLHVLHVLELGELPPEVADEGQTAFAERGNEAVEEIADLAAEAGVSTTTAVLESDQPTHEAIVGYATDHDVDLVAMGTHGRTGLDRYVIGSVTERTLRTCPVPVLTVGPESGLDLDALGSVLVPTDGSETATRAVDLGADLAATTGAAFSTLYVVDSAAVAGEGAGAVLDALEEAGRRAIDGAVATARDAGVDSLESDVGMGPPARTILQFAGDNDVGLVVMGTHGRTGLNRLLLGSVTERVVRQADVPVLTTPGPADDEGD